jgi:hypothetical protein
VHAAPLDLGALRVLVPVDHVLVDRQRHQGENLGFLPRLAERGQVLAGVAVEDQLVRHQLERVSGQGLVRGEPVFRDRLGQVASGEYAVRQPLGYNVPLVQRHG